MLGNAIINKDKPVLLDWQALLTASAHKFQKLVSFVIGHLLFHAPSQNKQMYCTNADFSFRVHSDLLPDAFSGCSDVGGLLSNRLLLLDFP